IAEMYELNLEDFESAIKFYEKASERYKLENSNAMAEKFKLKVGELSALTGKFEEGFKIFEELAKSTASNPNLKFGAKEHFFKACLCRLVLEDWIGVRKALGNSSTIDPSFPKSREAALLSVLFYFNFRICVMPVKILILKSLQLMCLNLNKFVHLIPLKSS